MSDKEEWQSLRITPQSIEEVREAAQIAEVASEFTALRRVGARFSGLCPYPDHNEKTPSFSVSPDKSFYYCFGCLAADERIWTSRGLIPIAAAEIGDEVIGLDGRRETITDKMFKSGPTLKVRTGAAKEGIELTPDHWCIFVKKDEAVLAVSGLHRRSENSEQIRISGRLHNKVRDAKLTVEHASSIETGDFWLYPVIPNEDRTDSPLPGGRIIKPDTKGPRTERSMALHVNRDTAWLYGIYAAEGSLYRGGVKWSFGLHESETLAARVVTILEKEFGKPSTKTARPEKNICEVMCSSTDLAVLFGHWFGRGCENKRVPIEALSWTVGCQEAFIEGYVDGDGYVKDRQTSTATVSEELAYGFFALCVQTRKVCSMASVPERTGKDGVRRRKTYHIHILCKESVKGFYAPIYGTTYYWSIIQEIETCRDEPTAIVDITTTGSHTFLTKMGITHNCQRGGDAIKLVMELKSFSFTEAVSHLAERFGVELRFEGRSPEEERAAEQRNARRRSAYKALAAATAYYHKYLLKSPAAEEARRYLEERGFERSTIEEFRLGYAPPRGRPGFVQAARGVGLGREALEAAGLLSSRGGERFGDRVTFPISDRRGRIVGFGARSLGDAKPKYLNSPETELFNKRSLLYGFPQVAEAMRREKAALVVEGYTDVLMLYQSGIKNAVATLGTAMTEQHLKTLSGHAEKIYLLFDPDEAGEKVLERTFFPALEMKLDLRVVRLSNDPADWLLEHSAEEFKGLLDGAVSVLEYGIRQITDRYHSVGASSRARALPDIKDRLRRIEDPVLKREALRLAAEALGMDSETLREELREEPRPAGTRYSSPRDGARSALPDPLTEAGRELLALALAYPHLTEQLLKQGVQVSGLPEPVNLGADDFGDEAQGHIFQILQEHPGKGTDAVLSDERARPYLDLISVLSLQGSRNVILADKKRRGQKMIPSKGDAIEAWLRLLILSREQAKSLTEDYEHKERIRGEIAVLRIAQRQVSTQYNT